MMLNQAVHPQAMRTVGHQKQETWLATMVILQLGDLSTIENL